MDLAKCTHDGNVYTAIQFSQFPEATRQTLRRHLVCTECNQEAFFRSKSRDGKKACFFSWKHRNDCRERHSSGTTSQEERNDLEVVHEIIRADKILVLDRFQ